MAPLEGPGVGSGSGSSGTSGARARPGSHEAKSAPREDGARESGTQRRPHRPQKAEKGQVGTASCLLKTAPPPVSSCSSPCSSHASPSTTPSVHRTTLTTLRSAA
nr:hypothetical protein CFP56_33510 [Quercus suber]